MSSQPPPIPLTQDPLLQAVPTIEGFKVLGKTILLENIGSGGMGVVYRGWHMAFRIAVAVKVLRPTFAADRDYVRRFRSESQAALRITHQNVVRAYDVEERHGLHYFVMEFVDGESARQRVRRRGRMATNEAFTVFVQAAAGLAEAHAHGLVHRDVKPGNLLIARSGRVKLADLGLVGPAMDTDEGDGAGGGKAVLGTPHYMAPEQWQAAPSQPNADVWALGATLYFLRTGQHGLPRLPKRELRAWVRGNPFPTLRPMLTDLPELDAIFERCVQREPADRFATAGELHQALLALSAGDEELLRGDEAAEDAGLRGLPPNEVLGRIDIQRKRPTPIVAPRRRAPAPARGGSGLGLAIVVVVAVIAIVGALLYLRSTGDRTGAAPTTEQGGAAPAEAPSVQDLRSPGSPSSSR